MKNCIVQVNVDMGPENDSDNEWNNWKNKKSDVVDLMIQNSEALAKYYAEICNADYHMITEHWLNNEESLKYRPGYAKLQLFIDSKWVDQYDNILYVDTDAFIWPWAPNVFDIVPSDAFSVVDYPRRISDFSTSSSYLNSRRKSEQMNVSYKWGIPADVELRDKFNFNAGVFVTNRYSFDEMNKLFEKYPQWRKITSDQLALNRLCTAVNSTININLLNSRYNAKARYNVRRAKKQYITHLWGQRKYRNDYRLCKVYNEYIEEILKNITQDSNGHGEEN